MTIRKKTKRAPKRPWSFLVYIAGDNDLSSFGLSDIQEMCKAGSSSRVHVGVEIDTLGDHTGSIRYEITEPDWSGRSYAKEIERLPERDSGDPQTLIDFLKWGLRRYTSTHPLVVVWNHGSGFRRGRRRDIASDDFGSSLDMPELEGAFRAAGISRSNRIRVLGFDACLMNMVEVVHQFDGLADIVVGSQQTEPGEGWPYDQVLRQVKTGSSPDEVAKGIVAEYIKSYKAVRERNVTQSAVAVAKTGAVLAALGEAGKRLADLLPAQRLKLRQIRLAAQSYEFADYVDLIHLLGLLRSAFPPLRPKFDSTVSKANACILANGWYGSAVKNSNGLSVWFPASADMYSNYRTKYLALKGPAAHRGWLKFLDAYHAS